MSNYNPMSKEFQDECRRLGITGRQLTEKYRKEGKSIKKDDIYVKNEKKYNETNTCDRCREYGKETKISSGKSFREKDKNGNWTGRWLCNSCRMKDNNDKPDSYKNIMKPVRNVRTGNQNQFSHITFGNNCIELACILYGWEDLNKKYDNYRTPIDCYDPKTGLYHQVQGRHYNSERGYWGVFGNFEREWDKKFATMICFCISNDRKTVERIYKFSENIVKDKSGITIVKNPMNTRGTKSIISWYEDCRVTDKDELNRSNEIWRRICR
jgi:hypothetical protein